VETLLGRVITMGLWDTAGAERFESLSRLYYNGAKAAIVCFDASNRRSWQKLQRWVRTLLLILMTMGAVMITLYWRLSYI
jgi:Ras-related protein Rab-24